MHAGTEDWRLRQEGLCAILRLLLGTPRADGAELYSQLCGDHSQDGLTLGKHPQALVGDEGLEGEGKGMCL